MPRWCHAARQSMAGAGSTLGSQVYGARARAPDTFGTIRMRAPPSVRPFEGTSVTQSTLGLRAGSLAAIAVLALGGLAAAAPAAAEPLAPKIELSHTSFPAGDWLGGFTVTGSGF